MSAGDQPRSINSPRVPSLARESRQSTSTADCRDSYVVARHDRQIDAQISNNLGKHFSDQPRVEVILPDGWCIEHYCRAGDYERFMPQVGGDYAGNVNRPRLVAFVGVGGSVEPFEFFSFIHAQPDSQGS